MSRHFYHGLAAYFAVVASACIASAQVPTFSLEAVQVNSIPLADGPQRLVGATPGDIVTMEVFARDWSPDGQQLYAYQTQIEPDGYTSGTAGFIEPPNYAATQESGDDNQDACFVDRDHPNFVHAELQTLAMTDTRSSGYRWTSILLQEGGPVSAQDGSKYYCGTMKLAVSENALGTFTLDLMHGQGNSGLRDGNTLAIDPVQFETLTIVVRPDVVVIINGLNETDKTISVHQVDIDRNGKAESRDVLHVIAMLNGAH